MVRKGRLTINIVVPEAKIPTIKTKIVSALQTLQASGDIESATWTLTYEEIPESGTV